MLLALDVGNSNTHAGIFERSDLRTRWQWETDPHRRDSKLLAAITGGLSDSGIDRGAVTCAAIASVVPEAGDALARLIEKEHGFAPLIVSHELKTGLTIRYDHPAELGADRIANAAAAFDLHGGPAIVIDCGTAITLCAITAGGDLLGGAIAPGMRMSASALAKGTALLPEIDLGPPAILIASNTAGAVKSGIVHGLAALVDGLVERMQAELGAKARVVATGGAMRLLALYANSIEHIDDDLTLKGLELIHRLNTG